MPSDSSSLAGSGGPTGPLPLPAAGGCRGVDLAKLNRQSNDLQASCQLEVTLLPVLQLIHGSDLNSGLPVTWTHRRWAAATASQFLSPKSLLT